jgi:hypothetical protein
MGADRLLPLLVNVLCLLTTTHGILLSPKSDHWYNALVSAKLFYTDTDVTNTSVNDVKMWKNASKAGEYTRNCLEDCKVSQSMGLRIREGSAKKSLLTHS